MRGFFTKKKIIWTVIILLVAVPIGYQLFKGDDPSANIQTDVASRKDLKQTVLSTGQVVSGTDLDLSFKGGGIVQKVSVKEGTAVKSGAVLATLDQKDQMANLTSARGQLAQAQANYNKVVSGASNEDVAVSQVALENAENSLAVAKRQQQVLVDNAYQSLLNAGLEAVPGSGNTGGTSAQVSGTYTGTEQGMYKITVYSTGAGLRFQVSGLETGDGIVDPTPQPVGKKGLYLQFSSTSVPTNNVWTISIPNAQGSAYITSYNAYQASLQTQASTITAAENAVAAARANLDLKKAQARPADLQAAQAQILSAQGQVQAAESALENTVIRAPADGTITSVDIKAGEQASALKAVMVLQDVGNLHAEAEVSEANIASVAVGQIVDYTFDALGPDRHFSGQVQTINPASTVVSGVVNYKVTASIPDIADIKPGMTVNMTIETAEKNQVLAIPSSAILSQNGKKFVRLIDDPAKKTYHQVEVQTGLEADGGLVEITLGLTDGQEVVTFIKK